MMVEAVRWRRPIQDPSVRLPHTYAQRHADNGTPVDVLRQLMDHKSIQTTGGYYTITGGGGSKRVWCAEGIRTLDLMVHLAHKKVSGDAG
jgi:integrase